MPREAPVTTATRGSVVLALVMLALVVLLPVVVLVSLLIARLPLVGGRCVSTVRL